MEWVLSWLGVMRVIVYIRIDTVSSNIIPYVCLSLNYNIHHISLTNHVTNLFIGSYSTVGHYNEKSRLQITIAPLEALAEKNRLLNRS